MGTASGVKIQKPCPSRGTNSEYASPYNLTDSSEDAAKDAALAQAEKTAQETKEQPDSLLSPEAMEVALLSAPRIVGNVAADAVSVSLETCKEYMDPAPVCLCLGAKDGSKRVCGAPPSPPGRSAAPCSVV